MSDVKDKAQKITFCGVESHHQNGITERRIRSFREEATTMLAQGQHLRLEVVTNTGLVVSPQYHVVFDDEFSTVDFIKSRKEPSNWKKLSKYHSEDYRMHAMPQEQTLQDLQAEIESMPQP